MRMMPLLSALSIAAGVVAAEVPVSQPAFRPAPGNQFHAAAASDGDQYLVVWTDQRSGINQAFAARVSAAGAVLDPHGIRLASGALSEHPQVVWSGSSWFVLANDCSSVEFVRVARDGTVLDPQPRALPIHAWCPGVSVASDGRHVAVGYVAGSSTYERHALILDGDGQPIADVHLSAGTYEGENGGPALAWDGSSFVAVWPGYAVRFDARGNLGAGRSALFLGGAGDTMSIASDGRELLVVRGALEYRLTADLVAEYRRALPFTDVQAILWTGTEYIVSGTIPFYEQNGEPNHGSVNMLRVDRDGHPLAQQTLRANGIRTIPANGFALATNGRNLIAAWHDPSEATDTPYAETDTYASILSLPALEPEPRRLLSVGSASQFRAVTAAGESRQLTVWQETSGLYAVRHGRDGSADSAPIRLSTETAPAAAAFSGTDFIVATIESGAVMVRRVPATGELRVDRESRLARPHPRYVALTRNGPVMALAWLDDGGLYAARAGADGALLDSVPLQVAPAALARVVHRLSIAPNRDGDLLIVWGGSLPGCMCSPAIPPEFGPVRGARVSASLTLLDAAPIAIEVLDPSHTLAADHPSVTSDGQDWLVVWNRSYRDAGEEIRGRRIARSGALLDGIASDPGILIVRDAFAPTVAWTGSGYTIGWYEGTLDRAFNAYGRDFQRIRTASFDRLGAPLSNERTLGESPNIDPISIAVTNGFATMAYARLADAARYGGVSRAFLILPGADGRPRAVRR